MKAPIATLLVAVLLSPAFAGQTPQAASTAPPQAAASAAPLGVTGVVRFNGLPVPGVTVTAAGADGKALTAVSDANGAYSFPALPAGAWTISVAMTGFAPQSKPGAATMTWDLALLPYTGPPVTASAPAPAATANGKTKAAAARQQAAPQRTNLNASAGAEAPPAAIDTSAAAANATFAGGDANRTAADAFAVNGSVNNGAASPFAQSPAFGNNRRSRSQYRGALGMTFDSSVLDASPFSLDGQTTPKEPYSRLTGLVQFGGPLVIPHLLSEGNRPINFVVTYQKSDNHNASDATGLVPTEAERQGILTAAGGPTLSPGSISPQATALLDLYPLPNLTGNAAYNYQVPILGTTHMDAMQARVNRSLDNKNQLATTFAMQSSRSDTPNLFDFLDTTDVLGLRGNVTLQHSFTTRLHGTFSFDYTRQRTALTPFFDGVENISGDAGIEGNNQQPVNWGPPTLVFSSGIASLADGQAADNRNQTGAFGYAGYWNRGSHNVSFGADYRRLEFNYLSQQNARGTFTFNGAATGNDLEDFLLGTPDTSALAYGNADKYFRESSADGFVVDDWRFNSSLTLNLGMRWEYTAPITELYGRLVNLDIAPDFSAEAPVLGSDPVGPLTGAAYPSSLLRPDKREFEPRLGLAWRPLPASSLVIHAGYGIYYNTSVYQSIATQMAQQSPLSTSLSVANTAAAPLTLANGFNGSPATTADQFAVDPNFRIGYAQTWNASLQRDLPGSLVMLITYLGIKGTRGPQEYLPNTYAPGAANPCPSCPVGFTYMASNGNSTDESGKAQLQRRFHSGFAATLVYTYAKAIDDSALGGQGAAQVVAQNWLNLDGERALSSFDQRQNVTAQTQYSTGVGVRGGTLLRGWRGVAYQGWTLTTALTAGTGMPLTPSTFAVVPGTGITQSIRPDATGESVYAAPPGLFLNPAAYAAPAAGQWGTAGRDSITGPGQFTLNAGMERTFAVNDRVSALLRFDATNALNHAVFPSFNTTFGSAQFGLPNPANAMRSILTTLRFTF